MRWNLRQVFVLMCGACFLAAWAHGMGLFDPVVMGLFWTHFADPDPRKFPPGNVLPTALHGGAILAGAVAGVLARLVLWVGMPVGIICATITGLTELGDKEPAEEEDETETEGATR